MNLKATRSLTISNGASASRFATFGGSTRAMTSSVRNVHPHSTGYAGEYGGLTPLFGLSR